MKRTIFKTLAATGAAALLLSGCSLFQRGEDTGSGSNGEDGGSDNAVYNEMASWNACEVLDNLQPITEKMGIQGYGSSSATGGEPGNSEIGNTFDPEAIGCNGLIYLGSLDGVPMNGEIEVKIVPTENEEQATTAFEDRVSQAESDAAQWTDVKTTEFGDPWDQGTQVSWIGDVDQPHVQVVARDGQWLTHIDLYYSKDFGLDATGDPLLPFTPEELNQWFVDTYLPEVNQIVNDRIAEVQ
jgi:hypothetical protein